MNKIKQSSIVKEKRSSALVVIEKVLCCTVKDTDCSCSSACACSCNGCECGN